MIIEILIYCAAVITGTVFMLFLMRLYEIYQENKWASWMCPTCNVPFGSQETKSIWVQRNGKKTSGPVLKCKKCGDEYLFTYGGKFNKEKYDSREQVYP